MGSKAAPVPYSHRLSTELLPLVVAFLTISFAFGVVAREAQLTVLQAFLMSAFVYAGTSQVVALGLMAAGSPIWMILVITALINGRFFLLSTAMVRPTASWPRWMRVLFAVELTDETFALFLNPRGAGLHDPQRALWIQFGAHAAWVGGTMAGYAMGADSSQLRGLGLDFALVAMMLAVLVLQIRSFKGVMVALTAAVVAIVASQSGLAWAAPLLAALLAPAAGVFLEMPWKAQKLS